MARWESNSPYVNIDLNLFNTELRGDWPNIVFHFDCDFNYYCPTGYAIMNYNNINFHTDVDNYTGTKTENVAFNITAGQVSSRYGANNFNLKMENKRQTNVNIHGWISNGLYTGGGWTILASPTINNPTNLKLSITNITQNSCVVTHSFSNVQNYWFVRLWDRNTNTYYNLNTNNGNGATTLTGLNPNQTYAFELWACGRDGSYYYGSYPSQTITTLGKSSIGNNPSFTIGKSFLLNINGYSDSFTHDISFTIGDFEYKRSNLKRGNVTIETTEVEDDAMYEQLQNATTKSMDITLETFVDEKSIGTNHGTGVANVDLNASAPSVDGFTYEDIDEDAFLITENHQFILQNVSRIQVKDIRAQAKKHAFLTKYRMEVSDKVYESNAPIIQSGSITKDTQITMKAIDSRGLQGYLTKPISLFIPYEVPIIKEFHVQRLNDVDTITKMYVNGTYAQAMIQEVAKNEIKVMKYRYKKTTDTKWSEFYELVPVIYEDTFTFDNRIGNFDVDVSYHFEIQISDRIRTSTLTAVLVVGKPILSIRKKGIGINKVPDNKDCSLDVSGSVHSDTGFYSKGNAVLSTVKDANGYPGFVPDEITDWFRTSVSGLLPYKSGGASEIGSEKWPFQAGFFQNIYKNGVTIPNDDEVPEIVSGNGWNTLKFPSGVMIQVKTYSVTVAVTNPYGSGFFGYVPPTTDYPLAFTTLYSCQATIEDNWISSTVLWNPTLANFTGGGNYFAYSFVSRSQTLKIHCMAIGRWK